MERNLEKLLYASRWLLAPLYVGMAFVLIAFIIKFFQEIALLLPGILAMKENDLILLALSLVDLVLVSSLLVMVMFSGYENFVSRIDLDEGAERLGWLGKLDTGTLKVKVAAAIVAISSIHLLKAFMNVQQISNDKLLWLVVMHLTFVVSALLLGYLDRLVFATHR